jgi:HEAT repeat protein
MEQKEKSELEKLIEALHHGNAAEREQAAFDIGQLDIRPVNPDAKLAVEALIEALSDEEPDVRYGGGQSLMFLGVAAFAAIPELLHVFTHDEDSFVRESAGWALSGIAEGGLGLYNAQAVPLLIRALQDESEGIRGTATITLGKLVLSDPQQFAEVMAVLKEVAEDSNEEKSVRVLAYNALERLSGSNT